MEKMNDWAEKLMSVFPDRSRGADLDRYITEVNNDQAEQMFYQKELDEDSETRPTYEQLSLDRIFNEAQKNLSGLKALEGLVSDRLTAYTAYNASISKVRSAFEAFENLQGTLRFAFDSLYLFSEQEILQSKQQIFLGDLKRSLSEMRGDASKRISDYQREISSAEKEVAAAEKKLSKTKEQAASSEPRKKNRIEGFELDSLLFNAASRIPLVGNSSKERGDKSRDSEDSPGGAKDSTKDDVRSLLRAISYRDQVLKASRRALQKLDRECKKAMFYTLRKVVDKEKEHVELKKLVVDKFDSNIKGVDVVSDMDDFIVAHADEGGELVYSAQALSLLTDLFQPPPPPMVEETSRSRQPSISGGAVSPTRTPQSSPPAASNRKVLSGLPSTPPAAASHPIPAPPAFEFTGYLSQIFYTEVEATNAEIVDRPTLASLSSDSGHAPAHSKSTPSSEEDDGSVKHAHRKARVTNMDVKYRDIANQTEQQLLSLEANKALHEATLWLCDAVKTLAGREAFIAELNQFRSRKVNLGAGFEALAIVLWTSLSYCQVENDIRTAKVIMMLSQTFYRKIEGNRGRLDSEEADEEEDEAGRRGSQYRQYIKEKLMGHAIWQDGNFWEQTLWQCALEQTIPYEKPWHDMDKDSRAESVRRVHEVLFSQVMAVTHSMLELGCSKQQCREFLYRMCVIHELSEAQRHQLLGHVLRRLN